MTRTWANFGSNNWAILLKIFENFKFEMHTKANRFNKPFGYVLFYIMNLQVNLDRIQRYGRTHFVE